MVALGFGCGCGRRIRVPCQDAWRHRDDVARIGLVARLGGQHGRRSGFAPVSRSGERRGAVTQASRAAAMT
jgi:hypothetical protein